MLWRICQRSALRKRKPNQAATLLPAHSNSSVARCSENQHNHTERRIASLARVWTCFTWRGLGVKVMGYDRVRLRTTSISGRSSGRSYTHNPRGRSPGRMKPCCRYGGGGLLGSKMFDRLASSSKGLPHISIIQFLVIPPVYSCYACVVHISSSGGLRVQVCSPRLLMGESLSSSYGGVRCAAAGARIAFCF